MAKRFILNADGLGLSKAYNQGVLEGYAEDFLKSASIVPNGECFDDAINSVLPKCPELGIGVHLNIMNGRSLCEDLTILTNENGYFNNSYFDILKKAYNPKEKEFFAEVEREFRRQIEQVMSKTKVSHIDSYAHIHSIPKIFNVVCRLAKEYGIKQVRTHFEKPFIVPNLNKYISRTYYINLAKFILFNLFSLFNEATANDYALKTNDYLIGIIYSDMMEPISVAYGLSVINRERSTVEAVIHPCRYENGTIDNYFQEFMITKNKKLVSRIEHLGYEITNYVEEN